MLVALYAQVYMSVLLNDWYGRYYDILQKPTEHGIAAFWNNLWEWVFIVIPYILVATGVSYFTRLYTLQWREAITFNYIPRWRNVHEEIEGASQRIQEDTFRFARIVESLGLQVVRAIMTLFAFLPVLWKLSNKVNVVFLNDIPGALVWVAIATSFGGMVISWLVGVKLPGLEYNNQKVEAAFRKELVLGEDDKINHSSIETLTELFTGIRFNYRRLYLHYGDFDLWVWFYDQAVSLLPEILAAPALFAGKVTLGVIMQVGNAFAKVHNSFALFVHNWTTVTELRSIWKRLHEFEANLEKYKVSG
ncbi:MAG: SbmA protein [Parcubacteria group bacterium GW2011_GWA2_44_13]|nr:MAG: SbmA protein [Parcubacteria group bacterium GW2011_GWA2_44_13]